MNKEPRTVEGRGLLNWLEKSLVDPADRKAARDSIIEIERQAAFRSGPDVGNYGEQLMAKGGVIDPELERRIIERGG